MRGDDKIRPKDFFGILAHETRIRIIELLFENTELSYSELLKALNISDGDLNFHLNKMRGMLMSEEGIYRLNSHGVLAHQILRVIGAPRIKTLEGLPFVRASCKMRSLAMIMDIFFITIGMVLLLVIMGHEPHLISLIIEGSLFEAFIHVVRDLLLFTQILLVTWFILTLLEGYRGETLGKHLLGLRVVKTDGRRIDFFESAIRNIGKVFLPFIDFPLGLRYRGLGHHRFFGYYTNTTVIDTRRPVSRELESIVSK